MKVLEPGHIYELNQLDGDGKPLILKFVNREKGTEHEGTQTQEVLRMCIDILSSLIDRTNHCDSCLRWDGNDRIIKALSESQRQMRLAILYHEQRVLERKMEKHGFEPDKVITQKDGHYPEPPTSKESYDSFWSDMRKKKD